MTILFHWFKVDDQTVKFILNGNETTTY